MQDQNTAGSFPCSKEKQALRGKLASYFSTPKFVLGPMAGVSDRAMRHLSLNFGADLTYSEMVSSKGLAYANEKTRHLLELADNEETIVVQLFGNDPSIMARQAQWVESELGNKLFYIDVNMGCPAPKISKKGDGGALMKNPQLAGEIVSAIKASLKAPVAAKFRRGFNEDEETAVAFAQTLEEAGADLISVHGRYVMQFYRGCASWEAIARVKQAVSIPVIGNGDVKNAADAFELMRQTHCDGVMIARGACGNPWIFSNIKALSDAQNSPLADSPQIKDPSYIDRIEMARIHAALLSYYDDRVMVRMRKMAMFYLKGIPGASAARARINECHTIDDFEEIFDYLICQIKEHDYAS